MQKYGERVGGTESIKNHEEKVMVRIGLFVWEGRLVGAWCECVCMGGLLATVVLCCGVVYWVTPSFLVPPGVVGHGEESNT